VIPPARTLTAGGATPSRTQHPVPPLAGRGWNQNLGPLNLSAVVAPLGTDLKPYAYGTGSMGELQPQHPTRCLFYLSVADALLKL